MAFIGGFKNDFDYLPEVKPSVVVNSSMEDIKIAIEELGYKVGCITTRKLSKSDSKKVIVELKEQQTDVKVKGGYIEIVTVDNEKDILFVGDSEYRSRYLED